MANDELAGLSREELLELVRRQQEALAEREAAIKRRDEKIRALEEELLLFRRPAKTPENSSVPPSRGQKANRVAGRRRKLGPKRGHVGVSRERSEPDVVVECRPHACAGCGQCGEETAGTYPAGLEPRRTFGPGVEALLSYLHERHHVGYERLVEICRDVFALAISQGGVEHALRRLVER